VKLGRDKEKKPSTKIKDKMKKIKVKRAKFEDRIEIDYLFSMLLTILRSRWFVKCNL
jgi:hypothetical protein